MVSINPRPHEWDVSYEVLALVASLVVGSLLIYAVLYSRMTNKVVGHARRMLMHQKGQLEASFMEAYEAKLEEEGERTS